ncbi:MAG TPA: cytochrome c [Candidatus Aminicenantes bacterium]|nr:cytochrome c [Candidatus Aminicenantes bacterium]
MMTNRRAAIVTVVSLCAALGFTAAPDIPEEVKSLVGRRCAGCHKGRFPPKGLNLEPANLAAVLDAPSRDVPEAKLIDIGAPEASYLLKKVRREKGVAGGPMPPGKALTPEELKALENWILGLI